MFDKKLYRPIKDAINSGKISKDDIFLFGKLIEDHGGVLNSLGGIFNTYGRSFVMAISQDKDKFTLFLSNNKFFKEAFDEVVCVEKHQLAFLGVRKGSESGGIIKYEFHEKKTSMIMEIWPFNKSQCMIKAWERLSQMSPHLQEGESMIW